MDIEMNKWTKILSVVIFLSSAAIGLKAAVTEAEARQKAIEILTSVGLSEKLNAPVNISADTDGVISIADEGNFFMQYMVVDPNISADGDLIMDPNIKIPDSAVNIVIVTHGWIDKAGSDWPADVASEIRKKVDANKWVCGFFDWRGGAAVVTPINAVNYGRTVAGPRLAKAVLNLGLKEIEHVHLIAHSAGCWTIDAAAEKIARQTNAKIHLTFLDAYVPPKRAESELGKIESENTVWAEHYYTKDITLDCTQENLSAAHNVDITQIDPIFAQHEFPYRWYRATVAGKYRSKDWEVNDKVITEHWGMDYGFARSLEAGPAGWAKSLTLKMGNDAIKLKKPGKNLFDRLFDMNIFKQDQKEKK
jgi:hypothetical protein